MTQQEQHQQQYMLLFTIGPVQSFIAQARKTRDLWLGSYLLSVLMEESMVGIESQLVFPADPKIKGKIPDLPNKFIAIFNSEGKAKEVAEKSQENLKKCWEHICNDVWRNVLGHTAPDDSITHTIWKRQVNFDRFFEVFWVIVEGNDSNYKDWLADTQVALAARKRLRHVHHNIAFDDAHKEFPEAGEKSTISGEREALRRSDSEMYRNQVRDFWKKVAEHLSPLDINPVGEERLDAIDTVKRFAYKASDIRKKLHGKVEEKYGVIGFPSTSSIATASFVEQLLAKSDPGDPSLKKWLDATADNSLGVTPTDTIPYLQGKAKKVGLTDILSRDGDCFFQETFVPTRLEKDYKVSKEYGKSKRVADIGREGLSALLKSARSLEITLPTPYYAMIQMDGDKMGQLLGKVKSKEEHKEISRQLSIFSGQAAKIVEEKYPGRLIYAGGDDVFALAPLARDKVAEDEPLTVIQLAYCLQQQYQETVKQAVKDEDRKNKVTASTGIAFAHHFTALSYVRRASKEAESGAKRTYGRNALVVTVLRRSGQQTRVGCKWQYVIEKHCEAETLYPIPLLTEFYNYFRNDVLSPKCVYLLLEEAPSLVDPVLALTFKCECDCTRKTEEEIKHEREKCEKRTKSEDELLKDRLIAMQKSEVRRVLLRQSSGDNKITEVKAKELADQLVDIAVAMDAVVEDSKKNKPQKKEIRATELHAEERRYGLVEVLGWLETMVFLARKGQE